MAVFGGHECEFLLEVPHGFKCPICHLVLRQPVQLAGCGHRFCQMCIDVILEKHTPKCPVDRKPIKKNKVFEDVACNRQILDLHVKCSFDHCPWQGELRSLEKHQKQCPFEVVTCTNSPCKEKITRGNLEEHSTQHCSWRPFSCPHCSQKVPMNNKMEHMQTCKRVPVSCENGCSQNIPQEEMNFHIMNDCPLTEVPCEYHFLGCQAKVQRQLGHKHKVSEVQQHLNLACKRLKVAEEQIAELREKANIVPFVWKIDKFSALVREMQLLNRSQRKEESVNLKSPPFYTRHQGYKLQMNVKLSQRPSDEVRVEFSCCPLPGEYDVILEWNLLAGIQFTVFDQTQNVSQKKNIVQSRIVYFGKPTSDSGRPQILFILPLAELQKQAYIANDAVYVEIRTTKRHGFEPMGEAELLEITREENSYGNSSSEDEASRSTPFELEDYDSSDGQSTAAGSEETGDDDVELVHVDDGEEEFDLSEIEAEDNRGSLNVGDGERGADGNYSDDDDDDDDDDEDYYDYDNDESRSEGSEKSEDDQLPQTEGAHRWRERAGTCRMQ